MATIRERKGSAKDGTEVTLQSPPVGVGAELLATVKAILAQSPHLLTELDEFTYTPEQEDEMIRSYLGHPDQVIIVPWVAGKPAGMMEFCCGSRRRNAHQGEFGMSVHPAYQGLGIGRMMLETLIEWARENPRIETVRLRVHARNDRAIGLYRSVGFIEEGLERDGVKLSDGSYDDVVTMALSVRP